MADRLPIVSRILIALLFVMTGIGKLTNTAGTAAYIESATPLSGILALPTGLFEVAAGLLLVSGRYLKLTSVALIGFTILATALFHNNLGDQVQLIMALKNLAIIGGLLLLYNSSDS